MGTEWTDNRKNLMLFSGRAHPELAEQVAKELDVHVTALRKKLGGGGAHIETVRGFGYKWSDRASDSPMFR